MLALGEHISGVLKERRREARVRQGAFEGDPSPRFKQASAGTIGQPTNLTEKELRRCWVHGDKHWTMATNCNVLMLSEFSARLLKHCILETISTKKLEGAVRARFAWAERQPDMSHKSVGACVNAVFLFEGSHVLAVQTCIGSFRRWCAVREDELPIGYRDCSHSGKSRSASGCAAAPPAACRSVIRALASRGEHPY